MINTHPKKWTLQNVSKNYNKECSVVAVKLERTWVDMGQSPKFKDAVHTVVRCTLHVAHVVLCLCWTRHFQTMRRRWASFFSSSLSSLIFDHHNTVHTVCTCKGTSNIISLSKTTNTFNLIQYSSIQLNTVQYGIMFSPRISTITLLFTILIAISSFSDAFAPSSQIQRIVTPTSSIHMGFGMGDEEPKKLTRDNEPDQYFSTNLDKMSDQEKLPIAIGGFLFISLPFVAGLIALYASK